MKLVFSVGGEPAKGGAMGPIVKLALVGLVALLAVNRADIRRYLRLRSM